MGFISELIFASADVDCIDMTKIIADICGAHPGTVSLDSELSSLGVDSLLSLELADRLQEVCAGSAVSSDRPCLGRTCAPSCYETPSAQPPTGANSVRPATGMSVWKTRKECFAVVSIPQWQRHLHSIPSPSAPLRPPVFSWPGVMVSRESTHPPLP